MALLKPIDDPRGKGFTAKLGGKNIRFLIPKDRPGLIAELDLSFYTAGIKTLGAIIGSFWADNEKPCPNAQMINAYNYGEAVINDLLSRGSKEKGKDSKIKYSDMIAVGMELREAMQEFHPDYEAESAAVDFLAEESSEAGT